MPLFAKQYLKQVLIALDQLFNTLAGGWADETFSARCWRLHHRQPWRVLRWLIDRLFWFDPAHCFTSYVVEANGGHMPEGVRNLK